MFQDVFNAALTSGLVGGTLAFFAVRIRLTINAAKFILKRKPNFLTASMPTDVEI